MTRNIRTLLTTAIVAFVASAFLLIPTNDAQAQGSRSSSQMAFSIGPTIGMHKAKDADEANYLVGAQSRLRLSPFFGLDGTIAYRQEDYVDNAVTVKSWPVQASALVYPLPVLYGTIGAGWYNVTFDINDEEELGVDLVDDETQTEFGWHFGGGVEVPISPAVDLTGDVRYVFLDYEFEQSPTSDEVDSDFYMISAGLLFHL